MRRFNSPPPLPPSGHGGTVPAQRSARTKTEPPKPAAPLPIISPPARRENVAPPPPQNAHASPSPPPLPPPLFGKISTLSPRPGNGRHNNHSGTPPLPPTPPTLLPPSPTPLPPYSHSSPSPSLLPLSPDPTPSPSSFSPPSPAFSAAYKGNCATSPLSNFNCVGTEPVL